MSISNVHKKVIRGRILRALRTVYPSPLTVHTISLTLAERHLDSNDAQVERHLHYMEEKGYVAVDESDEDGIRTVAARLRAKGMDLTDGNIDSDPGIEVS